MKKIKYSWILPIKNEAESLPKLFGEIRKAMRGKSYEIVAVDDASKDNNYKVIEFAEVGNDFFPHLPNSSASRRTQGRGRAQKALPPRKLSAYHFISHQGKWAALREGIKNARGDIIITSDSDLQDDPKEVKKLLAKFVKGYDLVSGWRKMRQDPYYKIIISKIGNYLVSMLNNKKFKDINAPFKVYKKEVLDAIPKEGSFLRFSLLFADKMGYKTSEVPVNHRPRIYGKSKFGLIKYLRIIYDLILIQLLFSGSGKLKKEER